MMLNKIFTPALTWATVNAMLIPLYMLVGSEIFNDVDSYYQQIFNQTLKGNIPGVTEQWFYPVAAIIPITVAGFIGTVSGGYLTGWVILVSVLTFTATYLVGRKYSLTHAQMLPTVAVSILLSGIFYYRLDIIAISLTIIALVIWGKNKPLAYLLLTVGVLVKIWPAAIIAAIWLNSNTKIKDAILVFAYTVTILTPGLILGGLSVPLSFITTQQDRGIQAESLYAIPLYIQGNTGYFSTYSKSYEIVGYGAETYSTLSTTIIITTLLAVLLLGLTKYWKTPATLVETVATANIIVIVFILFNKVSSTQFPIWLIITLLMTFVYIKTENIKQHLYITLTVLAATGLIHPYLNSELLNGSVETIILLMVKHVMLFILLSLNLKVLGKGFNKTLTKK